MSWQDQLEQARTEADVVALVREFMATVSPWEVARLPEALRPRKITDASDVTQYAFDLVTPDLPTPEPGSGALLGVCLAALLIYRRRAAGDPISRFKKG